jgi:hypothetical protein
VTKAPKFGCRLVLSIFLFRQKIIRSSIFAHRKIMHKPAYLRVADLFAYPHTFDWCKLKVYHLFKAD